MKSKNVQPITSLTLTARVSQSDHQALRKTARWLHTKPGVLAGWVLQVYAAGKPDLKLSKLISLGIVANDLFKLSQRLFSFRQALRLEADRAEFGSSRQAKAQTLYYLLGPQYQRTLAAVEICQGIAASLVDELPEEARPYAEAAKKILSALPASPNGDAQNPAVEQFLEPYLRRSLDVNSNPAAPGSGERAEAKTLLHVLGPQLQRTLAAIGICQRIATSLAEQHPEPATGDVQDAAPEKLMGESLQHALDAIQACQNTAASLAEGLNESAQANRSTAPASTAGDVQKLAAYLRALAILPAAN